MPVKVLLPRITQKTLYEMIDRVNPEDAQRAFHREQPGLIAYVESMMPDKEVSALIIACMTVTYQALKMQMEKGD